MPVLRLFAAAREAAGTGRDHVPGATVDEVIAEATRRYGDAFAAVLPQCQIWLNGDTTTGDTPVTDADELAVLPPVSGGS
ncbi:MAG: MoaD/ThiS family protein [Acidimicrobiales bacterium]